MNFTRPALVLGTAVAALVLAAAPSLAAPGPTFGRHVSDCAQTMGFSGTHNPGMHQGAAGWDGSTCAP